MISINSRFDKFSRERTSIFFFFIEKFSTSKIDRFNKFPRERAPISKDFQILGKFPTTSRKSTLRESHLKSEIRIMEARLIGPFAPSHAFASASCSSGPSHGHSSPANRFEIPMGAIIVPSHQVRAPEGPPTEGPSHRGNEPRPRLSSNALSLEFREKRKRDAVT